MEIQFLTLKSESTNKDLQAMDSKDQSIQKWILKYANLSSKAQVDSDSFNRKIASYQYQINILKRENYSLKKFLSISDIKPIEQSAIKMLYIINNSLDMFLYNLTPSTKRTSKSKRKIDQPYSSYENMNINHERAFSAEVPTEVRKFKKNKNEDHDTDVEILDFSRLNEINKTNFSTTRQIKNNRLIKKQDSLRELIRRIYQTKKDFTGFVNQSPKSEIEKKISEKKTNKMNDFQIQGFLFKMKNEIQRFLIRNNIFRAKQIKSRNNMSPEEINDLDDSKIFQISMDNQKINPNFKVFPPSSNIKLKEPTNIFERDSLNITDKELLAHALINSSKSKEKVSRIEAKLEDLLAVNSNCSKTSLLIRNYTPSKQMKFNSTLKNTSQVRPNTDTIHKKRNLFKPSSFAELGHASASYKKEVPHISLNLLDKYFVEGKKQTLRSSKKEDFIIKNSENKKNALYNKTINSDLLLSFSKTKLKDVNRKSESKLMTIKSPALSPICGNDQVLLFSGIQEMEEHNSNSIQIQESNNKKDQLLENKIELKVQNDRKSFEMNIPEIKQSNDKEVSNIADNTSIKRQNSFPISNSILKCAFSYCLRKKHH